VARQSYPNIEHFVVDGGSNDTTLELLRSAAPNVHFISVPGCGQAAAVNRAAASTSGEFLLVLNADDLLVPEACALLVEAMLRSPEVAVVYGEADHIDEHGSFIERYPTLPFDRDLLRKTCFISQPTGLVRRSAFTQVGGMAEALEYSLDYDFWIRLAQHHEFLKIDALVAHVRLHPAAKTVAKKAAVAREVISTLKSHYAYAPYEWVVAYADHLIDERAGRVPPAVGSGLKAAFSLPLGCVLNYPKVGTFARDWLAHRRVGSTLRAR